MILIFLLVDYFRQNDSQFLLVPLALLVVTMTWLAIFTPLARIWFGLSHILGGIASKVLLALVFFLVATPIGLLRRMKGADDMRLKILHQRPLT